jgi:multiple sugar transport system permease protein
MIESGRRRSLGASIRLYIVLGIYLLIVTFPFYYMALTSLRTQKDVYDRTAMLIPRNLTLENYQTVLTSTGMRTWMRNSVIVASSSTLLSVAISVFAAYSLARLRFFGSQTMAKSVLFMYLIPSSLLFIPLFLIISNLRLLNTLWALIISYQTFNVPFCTWLLLGYFRTLPEELEDAARIDGCSRLGVLFRIVLPLAGPGIITAGIFGFTNAWNEFLYAVVMAQRTELRTIPAGLYSFQVGDVLLWGQLMAAALIATLPVVVLFTLVQRFVVQGLTVGAVKG